MPYRIRWEGHGVYRRFYGVLTAQEFREASWEIANDVRYEDIRYIITDFLEAQLGPDVTEKDAEAFAEFERRMFYSSPDIVNAAVVTDPKILAHVRQYEATQLSPYPLGVFATVAEARRWIASNPRPNWSSLGSRAISPESLSRR